MHDPRSYLRKHTLLPENELDWMMATAGIRRLARGDAFLGIGVERHELGYVQDGILQCYGVSQDGDHVVLDLVFPGQFVAALDTALQELPSEVCFEAVVPAVLLAWPFESRDAALARHPGWLQFHGVAVSQAFIRKQRQYLALRTLGAQARHARLEADFPEALDRVPLHVLASYLNITPQYLSTLRRSAASA